VGEVMPDVVTPYSWSLLKPITNNAFAHLLRLLKIKKFPKQGLFDLYKGRVYFNHTLFNRLLSGFYLGEPLQKKKNIQIIAYILKKTPVWITTGLYMTYLPLKIKRMIQKRSKQLANIRFFENRTSPYHFQKIEEIRATLQEIMNLHLSCTIFAELYYQFLARLCQGKKNRLGPVSVDALLSGIQGAESALTGRELWKLAREAQSIPVLKKMILETPSEQLETELQKNEKGKQFLHKIRLFLDQYGHGALHEFELFYPRWQENPEYIYNNLIAYLLASAVYFQKFYHISLLDLFSIAKL
jgi:pyruvate,water dikinase